MSRVVCRTSIRPKLRNSSRFGPPIRFLRPSRSRARAKVTRRIDAASRPRSIRARAPVRSFARKSRKRSWTRCCMETALPTTCALSPSCPTTCTFSRCFAKVAGSQTSLEVGRAFRRGGFLAILQTRGPFWSRDYFDRYIRRRGPFRTGARLYREQPCHRRAGVGSTRLEVQQRWPSAMKLMTAAREDGGGGGCAAPRAARHRNRSGGALAAVSITPSSAGAADAPGGRSKSARIFLFPKIRKTCYAHRVRCRKHDLDGRQV